MNWKGVGGLSLLVTMLLGCASTNPYFDPNKPHHRPDGFVNTDGTRVSKPLSDLLRWYRERFGKELPPPPGQFIASYADFPVIDFKAQTLAQHGPESITWLGHAGVLVHSHGFNLLTDPHFSPRAFPVQWMGPERKVRSPAAVKDLPKIDVVVISHSHYDHLDHDTIVALSKAQPDTLFLVPLGVEKILQSWGVTQVKALDWWETLEYKGSKISFVPAYHWSARGLTDRNKTLWGGWVLEHPELKFYYTGDTGYSQDFQEIAKRYGPFDASAIAVGAYEPRWFMKAQHINPAEAVQIHREVASRYSIGVHWGTFELTDEPLDQPIGDLAEALKAQDVPASAFELLQVGQTKTLVP
ncbi:MAG TPA: MBL fold metallo-hydrolase [Limnobacter sp.]|nr:MBL fold metallo-hydrolase [Limnobacter sp.]